MRHRATIIVLALALILEGASPALARPPWKRRIDRLVAGRSLGVSVWTGGTPIYEHRAKLRRIPASNQKLLTSMALLDVLGAGRRLATIAAVPSLRAGVVRGNLWILGRGDPSVAARGPWARTLSERATRIGRLARRIVSAGVRRVRGRVMGSTGYFRRDWNAPGWRSYYRSRYIALPTALTFQGNSHRGRHVTDPERRLAAALTKRLRARGVSVGGEPGSGRVPRPLAPIARVWSRPLKVLLGYMNRTSSNFFAEVLGKRLAVAVGGRPGSIASAARATQAWAARRGVWVTARDASGLSYRNRISARGIVRLLRVSARATWARTLRTSLATPGRGTLRGRLRGVPVRAKTGTLQRVSALSGWVWLRRRGAWAQFSILSRGLHKYKAVAIEDRIVRILARSARVGPPPVTLAVEEVTAQGRSGRRAGPPLSDFLARALGMTELMAPNVVAALSTAAAAEPGG